MERVLNCKTLSALCGSNGFNQSQLAEKLEVSREAVSKWFKGEAMPRPDKLLRLGLLLKVKYSDLVIEQKGAHYPVVAYRKKAHQKTRLAHIQEAEDMGMLLEKLVPYLPFNQYQSLPALENPFNDYDYLQKICGSLRQELGISHDDKLDCFRLIEKYKQLNTVIIPVFWGEKNMHGQALHIYLPESRTTWIYLNLDAVIYDFSFWMAHELGHVYAPSLRDNEDFADAFAQTLLFPENLAQSACQELNRLGVPQRVIRIREIAEKYLISPYTIQKTVGAYIKRHSLTSINFGDYGAVTNFIKNSPAVGNMIFGADKPDAKNYIEKTKGMFKTPFFDALKTYLEENGPKDSFVQQVMQIPLVDAKALAKEL